RPKRARRGGAALDGARGERQRGPLSNHRGGHRGVRQEPRSALPALRRVAVIGAASAVVAVAAFILIAPAFLRPGADRLALVQTPRDYGTPFETVEFRPPDQPIKLRAWWMPAAPAKAAIILVHGGGDDNRSLPYADRSEEHTSELQSPCNLV